MRRELGVIQNHPRPANPGFQVADGDLAAMFADEIKSILIRIQMDAGEGEFEGINTGLVSPVRRGVARIIGQMEHELVLGLAPVQVLADFIPGTVVPDRRSIRTGDGKGGLIRERRRLPPINRQETEEKAEGFHGFAIKN